jgi:uncharacterized membrane protein
LVVASFLTALVSGLLLGFLLVVMPGIGTLDDRGFLRAFQVIDRVIQNSQPAFVLVWGGSIVATIAAAVLALWDADGSVQMLVLAATVVYLLGAQLPTFVVNIPLNNELQSHDLDSMDEGELASARSAFEPRWNRWNAIRTFLACAASLALILALVRL